MPSWTLTRGADTRTLDAWGFTLCERTRNSFGTDTLRLFATRDLRAAAQWEVGQSIAVFRDGTCWFRGRITASSRRAAGGQHGYQVSAEGPWWYLDHLIYQVTHAFVDSSQITFVRDSTWNPFTMDNQLPGGPVIFDPDTEGTIDNYPTVTAPSSWTLLNADPDSLATTDTRSQILAALQYVLDHATALGDDAPFQIGTVDTGVTAFVEELRDVTCGEVIRRAARWTPDQISWVNYATEPPTINIRSRANRDPHTIDLADGETVSINLEPRHDLQVPGIRLNYYRDHQRSNLVFRTLDTDEAGDPDAWGALIVGIQLRGSYTIQDNSVDPPALDVVPGEDLPTGIAASLFTALGDLDWAGEILLQQQDLGLATWLQRRIKIIGGPAEWTDIRGNCQSVTEEVFRGTTRLRLGPPVNLGVGDLLTMLRAQRARAKAPPLTEQLIARFGGGGSGSTAAPGGGGSQDPRIEFPDQTVDIVLRVHNYDYDTGACTGQGIVRQSQSDYVDFVNPTAARITASSMAVGAVEIRNGWYIARGRDLERPVVTCQPPLPFTGPTYRTAWLCSGTKGAQGATKTTA